MNMNHQWNGDQPEENKEKYAPVFHLEPHMDCRGPLQLKMNTW
jgi:hypothetical protein